MKAIRDSLLFALLSTTIYLVVAWKHQPTLLSRDPEVHGIVTFRLVLILALSAFAAFATCWYLLAARRRTVSLWASASAASLAALLSPILQLWILATFASAERLARENDIPVELELPLSLGGLLLASVFWLLYTLSAVAWFTVPLFAAIGICYSQFQRLRLRGTFSPSRPQDGEKVG